MSNQKRSSRRIFLLLGVLLVLALTAMAIGASPAPDIADEWVSADVDSTKTRERGPKSYIVVMEGLPLAAYDGSLAGFEATKPNAGNKVDANTPNARQYQAHLQAEHGRTLASVGAKSEAKLYSYTVALNGFAAILTDAQAKEMAAQNGVIMVLDDVMRQADTDSSPKFLGLTGKGEAYQSGVTGEGVVVGIIDSGIWPEHPSFADDGSYAPAPIGPLDDSVYPACDFGNVGHNADDVAFTCNNKLVGARQTLLTYRAVIGADPAEYDSARDDNGHGTHTASTAAGNAGVEASLYGVPKGTISGIAPRAHIIAYKGLGDLGGFTSDLVASIDQAVADGVDVINYSIGGGAGEPGGDEIAFLFAADAGVHVATSAGNSGPGPASLGNPGTMPWLTTVGASTQDRFFEASIKLYGKKAPKVSGASITLGTSKLPLVDAEFAGGDLCIPGSLDSGIVSGKIVLCRRGDIGRAEKSRAVSVAGGAGMIMYNNSDSDNLFTDNHYVPSVHIDYTDGVAIKDFIGNSSNPEAQIKVEKNDKWKPAPSMTIFSSRGPNPVAPDIIKPDITAPGIQILAGNTPTPIGGVPGELFQAIAGTSMSSPHMAGIFALLDQAHPDWSAATARSAVMTSAYQKHVVDNDRSSPADPFDMGAGHVDPGKVDRRGSAFAPGLVYDAGFFDYLGFLCDAFPDALADPAGLCPYLDSIGVPTQAINLNYPSIGVSELTGSQTVIRTVTAELTDDDAAKNKTIKFKAKVKAPEGYTVSVSPKRLSLKHGESASFEITITNKNAPSGEWRFGSLTWKGSGYEVYSPIAVNGALFGAPSAVSGSGDPGSTSFDVLFGYTGSYAAAAHGLSADAPVSGTVCQDPDQGYPSGDDAPCPGGVETHSFPITGAAYVRWEMSIPGADDIDLYLEDSGGNIVAQSTAGGTEELIEMWVPADDSYTMVVHGWSVPSEPLAYSLNYWEVPMAGGGNLSIDAAPASAVAGALEAIDLSWSGAGTGTNYGAVSHTGDVGLMGFTLIEVDVP